MPNPDDTDRMDLEIADLRARLRQLEGQRKATVEELERANAALRARHDELVVGPGNEPEEPATPDPD